MESNTERVPTEIASAIDLTYEPLLVPMGCGEIIDRTTILEIKVMRAPAAVASRLRQELAIMTHIEALVSRDAEVLTLRSTLRETNEALWEVEDALRVKESEEDFGSEFVSLARQVISLNDRRSSLKHKINERTGSSYGEVKVYPEKLMRERKHDDRV